jgi:hypothetical protein
MLSPQEFRTLAAQCVELADDVSPDKRPILLNMAEIWLRLVLAASQESDKSFARVSAP